MNLCIPVNDDHGLRSQVCAHFGSAPMFLIVDTDSGECRAVSNGHQHHEHGQCMPLASLQGERIDGMAVGGIGRGALNKLMAAGIQVYLAERPVVAEVVDALRAGTLRTMGQDMACSQHGHHGHDPQHGHDDHHGH